MMARRERFVRVVKIESEDRRTSMVSFWKPWIWFRELNKAGK